MKSTGFTLVEILIVIALITILSAISVPAIVSFQRNQTLTQASKKLKSDLRYVQNKALSSIDGRAWGINFVNGRNSYQIFSCVPDPAHYDRYSFANTTYCTASTLLRFASTAISITLASSPTDIVFDTLTGAVIVNGVPTSGDFTVQVTYGTDANAVTVGQGGRIED